MDLIGYLLVAVGVAAIAYGVFASRRRPDAGAPEPDPAAANEMDHRIRPTVASFHVEGEVARVDFAVPVPDGGADQVLAHLLGGVRPEVDDLVVALSLGDDPVPVEALDLVDLQLSGLQHIRLLPREAEVVDREAHPGARGVFSPTP